MQAELPVLVAGRAGVVPAVLRADAGELAGVPVQHRRDAVRVHARDAGVERVVAQADAPAGLELVHALRVPAGLLAAVGFDEARALEVEGELAVLLASEVLALELQLAARHVAVGPPLQDGVHGPGARTAGEGVQYRVAEDVRVFVAAVFGVHVEPRGARAPARGFADVAADVREKRRGVQAVAVAARRREGLAVAGFCAQFEEEVGGCDPLELQAVLSHLVGEHRLVHQRLVDEVPGVGVHFVEVAEAGEEAPALRGESCRQRGRAEVRLLDLDLVLRRDCRDQGCREVRIHVGGEHQLRFCEVEAALAGTDFAPARQEARDGPRLRILGEAGVVAGEDHRDRGVEGRGRAGRLGRGRRCAQFFDPGLERGQARGVIALQRLQFRAQRRDVIVGAGDCGKQCACKRQ